MTRHSERPLWGHSVIESRQNLDKEMVKLGVIPSLTVTSVISVVPWPRVSWTVWPRYGPASHWEPPSWQRVFLSHPSLTIFSRVPSPSFQLCPGFVQSSSKYSSFLPTLLVQFSLIWKQMRHFLFKIGIWAKHTFILHTVYSTDGVDGFRRLFRIRNEIFLIS